MRVYVVAVRTGGIEKLSQEAYSSLEAAQRFIKSRTPEPGRLSMMKFRDIEGREYIIHDLLVHEEKTFWRVCQKYFDDGRVAVSVYSVKAAEKPERRRSRARPSMSTMTTSRPARKRMSGLKTPVMRKGRTTMQITREEILV